MNYHFVFCHGWGFDYYFWGKLQKYFSGVSCSYLDLGYFSDDMKLSFPKTLISSSRGLTAGSSSANWIPRSSRGTTRSSYTEINRNDFMSLANTNETFIGIGHSLGLIKLLDLKINFKALIGIQAFTKFLGHDQTLRSKRTKELAMLQKHFQINPQNTLSYFYKKCGHDLSFKSDIINHQKLTDDLNLLEPAYSIPADVPLLILASKNDSIVPPEIIIDNFGKSTAQIIMHEQGNHCLGRSECDFVQKSIMDFLT